MPLIMVLRRKTNYVTDDRKLGSCQNLEILLVCSDGTCKNFERSADKVLTAKMILKRGFALTREIIHDHENGWFSIFFLFDHEGYI